MAEKPKTRATLFVRGRVQGVFFRAHTEEVARRLDLKGFVRNLPDGRVQVTAEGCRDDIENLIAWCREGPRLSNVAAVDVEWTDYQGEFGEFTVRRH